MNTTIINEETGNPITRITVMRSFTYDIDSFIPQLLKDEDIEDISELDADTVTQYALAMGIDDFYEVRLHTKDLIVLDQDGNEL